MTSTIHYSFQEKKATHDSGKKNFREEQIEQMDQEGFGTDFAVNFVNKGLRAIQLVDFNP